jgi:hypothetical protein
MSKVVCMIGSCIQVVQACRNRPATYTVQAPSTCTATLPETLDQPRLQRTCPAVRSMLGFTSSTLYPSSCAAAYTSAVLPHPTGPSSAITLHLQQARSRQKQGVVKRGAQAPKIHRSCTQNCARSSSRKRPRRTQLAQSKQKKGVTLNASPGTRGRVTCPPC